MLTRYVQTARGQSVSGKLNYLRQVRTRPVHIQFKRCWRGPHDSCNSQVISQAFIYSLALTGMSAKRAAKLIRLQNSLYNSFQMLRSCTTVLRCNKNISSLLPSTAGTFMTSYFSRKANGYKTTHQKRFHLNSFPEPFPWLGEARLDFIRPKKNQSV